MRSLREMALQTWSRQELIDNIRQRGKGSTRFEGLTNSLKVTFRHAWNMSPYDIPETIAPASVIFSEQWAPVKSGIV
jgi:hypothetical protein